MSSRQVARSSRSPDAALDGDQLALVELRNDFESLYRLEWPKLVTLAAFVSGRRDGAEDIAQEAFTRLAARWARISTYDQPESWLRLVTVRLARRSWTQRRNVGADHLANRPAGGGDIDATAATTIDVIAALHTLSRREREVLAYHVTYDMAATGIATELGIEPTTVRVTLRNARTKLARELHLEQD